jgi:hypothetical protein
LEGFQTLQPLAPPLTTHSHRVCGFKGFQTLQPVAPPLTTQSASTGESLASFLTESVRQLADLTKLVGGL